MYIEYSNIVMEKCNMRADSCWGYGSPAFIFLMTAAAKDTKQDFVFPEVEEGDEKID